MGAPAYSLGGRRTRFHVSLTVWYSPFFFRKIGVVVCVCNGWCGHRNLNRRFVDFFVCVCVSWCGRLNLNRQDEEFFVVVGYLGAGLVV
jgi:hypothetical protein